MFFRSLHFISDVFFAFFILSSHCGGIGMMMTFTAYVTFSLICDPFLIALLRLVILNTTRDIYLVVNVRRLPLSTCQGLNGDLMATHFFWLIDDLV